MQQLTPRQIVDELDRYIIGQDPAKRAVAVAIRNRWRRQQLEEAMAAEITPKNIVMIGPTGVGKTEIARRLASLTGAPFIKVEASKFTEVGYHGRDVESMIRDLVDQAIHMVRDEQAEEVRQKAEQAVEQRLLDLLLPGSNTGGSGGSGDGALAGEGWGTLGGGLGGFGVGQAGEHEATERGATGPSLSKTESAEDDAEARRREKVRQRLLEQLRAGKLEEREVEIEVTRKPASQAMFANMGLDQMDPEMSNLFEKLMPESTKTRRVSITEARSILMEEETDRLIDREGAAQEGLRRAGESGIVFLDEIDKVAVGSGGEGGGGSGRGPDISRQGVQRDLLPIVEGSSVQTRHGMVSTDHILFIAAGAFHSAAVSDLMPELQGRFPIRVELTPLSREDFLRILTEPGNALTKQQQQLLRVEGLEVSFDDEAVEAIADLAAKANAQLENIGARRLVTVVERLFEEVNFEAPELVASGQRTYRITAERVRERVGPLLADRDVSKFVL